MSTIASEQDREPCGHTTIFSEVQRTAAMVAEEDPVRHPPHYKAGGIETIDAIEAWGLGFHLGNAVKYISRAGKKDPTKRLEDLRKAAWYLERAITNEQKGRA